MRASPSFSQSLNRYSYVFNNPLSYVDPSGYEGESASGDGEGEGSGGDDSSGEGWGGDTGSSLGVSQCWSPAPDGTITATPDHVQITVARVRHRRLMRLAPLARVARLRGRRRRIHLAPTLVGHMVVRAAAALRDSLVSPCRQGH